MSADKPRLIIFSPEMVEDLLKRHRAAHGDEDTAQVVERVVLEKFDRSPHSDGDAEAKLLERLIFENGELVEHFTRDEEE